MMEEWRLFWAVEISEAVKVQIGELIPVLRKHDNGAIRWVRSGSIHVTLRFLGETDCSLVESMATEVKTAIAGIKTFTFSLSGFGCFPNVRAPRVVWIGINSGVEALSEIANRIEKKVIELGFEPEKRGFKPHLTLGRVKARLRGIALQEALEKLTYVSPEIIADKVCLIRSHLLPEGAKYETIHTIPLE